LARYPDRNEFVVYFADRHGFDSEHPPSYEGRLEMVWSHGLSTSITGWNAAAAASSGQLLLVIHDDMRPPKYWDTELLDRLPSLQDDYAFVLETSPAHSEVSDYDMVGLTRSRYERVGYVFFPQYRGSGAIQEFYMHAEFDTVIEAAPLLRFPHYHPKYGDGLWDSVYAERNSEDVRLWDRGLFQIRERQGFPPYGEEGFPLRYGATCVPPKGTFGNRPRAK
jgi:hypothetical protein